MEKRPVIIDTDLTLDDAVAFVMAAKSNAFDIKAVIPSGADSLAVMENINRLRSLYSLDFRTGQGAVKPLFDDAFDKRDVYGKTEDFAQFLPCCDNSASAEYAWDVIKDETEKAAGEMEIVTMGPLTNTAIALLRYPQIKQQIKRIVCAAGSGYVGNVLPYSEYNAYSDPYALQVVIDSGVPVVMCGLDGVENCSFTAESPFEFKAANAFEEKLADICKAKSKDGSLTLYSAVAVAYMLDESVAQLNDYYVAVETRSADNKGWTVVDRLGKYKKQPNISVVTDSSMEIFQKIVLTL